MVNCEGVSPRGRAVEKTWTTVVTSTAASAPAPAAAASAATATSVASAASAVSTIAATVRLGSKDIHGATGRRTSASAESAVTSMVKVALVRVSASASAAVAVEVVAIMIGMTRGSRRLGRG